MPFFELISLNVLTRKVRSILTGLAVAISIMTVVAMGVLTQSLRRTAISILQTGSADFTVAQAGVSDVLYSAVDEQQLSRIAANPDVESAVGVLVSPTQLDSDHPFFLRLGIQPEHLAPFGVTVVDGRPYTATADHEIMLGYRAARDLHKQVGDEFAIGEDSYTVVGIFSTGQVFGDSASMLPLVTLQAQERQPGNVTLAFVRTRQGADIEAVRTSIERDMPELATVRTESDFGRIDRNLELISAANVGITILALAVGAIGVMNTTLMSVFERTRELGVLRAIGWSRMRLLAMVWSEAFLIALFGAGVGAGLGFVAVEGLKQAPDLIGVFEPHYTADVFGRALGIAVGMALTGAVYPAIRAALLLPLDAIRHE